MSASASREKVQRVEGEDRCPQCGDWYELIGQHWALSSCSHPSVSEYRRNLLKGVVLGDGTVNFANNHPYILVRMTNKRFLEWLDSQLGWVSSGVSRAVTASQSAEKAERSMYDEVDEADYLDQWAVQTRSLPDFEEMGSWYETGEKAFPSTLTPDPTILKMWYVCDGGIQWDRRAGRSPMIQFSSVNESERPEPVLDYFEDCGFDASNGSNGPTFYLRTHETEAFFEYIGEPVPGFEYKFEYEDYERYSQLKERAYSEHCTQTLEGE